MFKILSLVVLSFMLTGCSLLPRITFEKPGVTPQTTVKTNNDERCAGEYKVNKDTGEISCTKGYYIHQNNFKQEDRKYTIQERIANFIRGLSFWWLIILVGIVLLCPGALGWFIGSVFNVAKTALTSTVEAIANFKNKVKTSTDLSYIKAANDLLDELSKAHSSDVAVQKLINQIRAEIK